MAKLTHSKLMQALDWTYEKVVSGVPGLDTAEDLANSHLKEKRSLQDSANALIRWQNSKAGTTGFVSGLGGIITIPIMIPANITSIMFIQVRMIAAIAHMGGHDLKDDRVKALVYVCLTGNAAKDILKETGIIVGTKLTTSLIRKIPGKALSEINKKVGFRLLTKFGQTGAVNLGKAVPLIGGIIGGTADLVATNTIGNIARDTFLLVEEDDITGIQEKNLTSGTADH